jgi:hypothetical protein
MEGDKDFGTPSHRYPTSPATTTSLQLPLNASPSHRPASTVMYASPVPTSPVYSPSGSTRKRASHSVTISSAPSQPTVPSYPDVYSHPAAVAYVAAHPKRHIPRFGPYLLLQTLGEGEFGKVKLGLHGEWGEEVAVKLIRRGSVDNAVRMSKVEREIEVLRVCLVPKQLGGYLADPLLIINTDHQTPKYRSPIRRY